MRIRNLGLKVIIAFSFIFLLQFQTAMAATYNVITPVANVAQPGSLPWCIAQANLTVGPDLIQFNHSQALDPDANSITVHNTLIITYPVHIDGNSITVSADNLGPQYCIQLNAGATGSTITGLAIVDSSRGIQIQTNSNCHMIYGNWFGTDRNDVTTKPNILFGIFVDSSYNQIGGNNAGARNIFSNNTDTGIYLFVNSSNNEITGNYIGLNNAGTAGLGSQNNGVQASSSPNNTIGGARGSG
jgi:parallel beta-helix repeat protein